MPRESYEELLTPTNDDSPSSEACAAAMVTSCDGMLYDGKNMEAVVEMLSFLNARLDVVSLQLLLCMIIIVVDKFVWLLQQYYAHASTKLQHSAAATFRRYNLCPTDYILLSISFPS